MEEKDYSLKNIREGSITKGKVIRKSGGDIFVDIGYKSEGIIPAEETGKYNYLESINPGEEVDVYIKRRENSEGMVVLSKIIADKKVIFSSVKRAHRDNSPIKGKVIKQVKGGYIIDFGANVTAFLPMSHSKVQGEAAEELLDRELEMVVIQLDEVKRNVVVSYRDFVAKKNKIEEEKISKVFPLNEKVKVTVKEIKEKGIDVEKDGIAVYISAEELSWKRIDNMGERFKQGGELEILVIQNDRGRPVLSAKRLKENPFKKFMEDKKQGEKIEVKVKSIVPEGIVAEINDELDGYVPVNEISYYRRVKDINEHFKAGDTFDASILKIDDAKNRVFLSVKRLEKNPWHSIEERYPIGARVFGIIRDIKEGDGADVELEENFDAYMHMSNVSWFNFNDMADVIKPGEKKEFKILGADRNKYRILLGLKQLMPSPWSSFINKFKEGNFIDVKIAEIEDNAVTCQIVDGVNGRISIKNKNKLKNKKGDIIKAKITKIDKEQKKVFLNAKDLEVTEEKKQLDEYMKKHEHSFKMDDIANFGEMKKEE